MGKTRTKVGTRGTIISTVAVILAITILLLLFLVMPSSEAVKDKMASKDFGTVIEVNDSTPILGLLLPKGATKSLTFFKDVNAEISTVEVLYFESTKTLKDYYNSLDEPSEGKALYRRGNAVIFGTKEAVNMIRWQVWLFN